MYKYIEFGIGNRWLLRTEVELENGTEYEIKGVVKPIKPLSIYLRIWMGKTVLIIDSKEGFKKVGKPRNAVKLIFGIKSYLK